MSRVSTFLTVEFQDPQRLMTDSSLHSSTPNTHLPALLPVGYHAGLEGVGQFFARVTRETDLHLSSPIHVLVYPDSGNARSQQILIVAWSGQVWQRGCSGNQTKNLPHLKPELYHSTKQQFSCMHSPLLPMCCLLAARINSCLLCWWGRSKTKMPRPRIEPGTLRASV